MLCSAVRAGKAGSLKSQCIRRAIADPALQLNNPEKFLERCSIALNEITKLKKQKYVLFCHVTYTGPKLFDRIGDDNCRIYWQPKDSNKFLTKARLARGSLSRMLRARGVSDHSEGLTALLVHLEAHNLAHAHELAIDLVDRPRGILNLTVNSTRLVNPFWGLSKPHAVNRFRLGPYRTIHHPDGSLAADMFWYEPRWAHEQEAVKFSDAKKGIRKNIRYWWKLAQINPLRDCIIEGLLRYCRALDQHDTDAALLGLWGALEYLTGTQKEKYDVTVSRIEKLFKDYTDARQIAQHLKLRRNSTVHAARSPATDEVDAVILHAEMLVSQIIFFCIKEGRHFRNPQELISFLDLPMDQRVLVRNKQLIGRFIKYQNR